MLCKRGAGDGCCLPPSKRAGTRLVQPNLLPLMWQQLRNIPAASAGE